MFSESNLQWLLVHYMTHANLGKSELLLHQNVFIISSYVLYSFHILIIATTNISQNILSSSSRDQWKDANQHHPYGRPDAYFMSGV